MYIKHHSRIASNRTTFDSKNSSVEVPVRYLDNSKIELYKNSIHKSTFFKYLNANKIYKKVSNSIDNS